MDKEQPSNHSLERCFLLSSFCAYQDTDFRVPSSLYVDEQGAYDFLFGGHELLKESHTPEFIYTYAYHGDERDLCQLEMRSFFGMDSSSNILKCSTPIDPTRSPFMKERIEVMYEGDSLDDILKQVENINLFESTFKVTCINDSDLDTTKKFDLEKRRKD